MGDFELFDFYVYENEWPATVSYLTFLLFI